MIRRRPVVALGLALGAVVVAGCASVAPPALLISGRLSLRVGASDTQAGRGMNASFDLLGTAERGELRLSTVLGPQIAAARWSPGQVTLSSTDGERRFASLDALAQAVLGEPVPLQALPDWVRGRPWPGAAARPAPDAFEQLGWQIDLARHAEGVVTASRSALPGAPGVVLRVRVEPR